MVFQSTVLGPSLWNLFFEDARAAINELMFTEVVYADDLNAFRIFGSGETNKAIETCMEKCQSELHAWGHSTLVKRADTSYH